MVQKQQLRTAMRRARQELDRREERSQHILARLWRLPEMASVRLITLYLNVRDEVVTMPAVQQARERQIRVAVPYCCGDTLRFAEIYDLAELQRGSFGVMEPLDAIRQTRPVQVQDLEVLVVPGLAFDRSGGRLGYGRGYYDRILSHKTSTSIAVGLAFDCQFVEEVPRAVHDQRVDVVVTESNTFRVSPT